MIFSMFQTEIKFMKIKVDWKTFRWMWPSGFEHPGHGTPKLAVSKELIQGVN